jgi:hypothetical protein
MDIQGIDPVASYSALMSTIALGWRIRREWRGQRPQVEVEGLDRPSGLPDRHAARAANCACNQGDHAIRVESAGFNVQDNSGDVLAIFSDEPGATIPGVIQARDSGFTYLLPDQLGKLDTSRPVVGWVSLSTGKRIHSEPTTLMRR